MFWNDPNLYTANLPYRELGNIPYREFGFQPQIPFVGQQTPLVPWQNVPRFIPPIWGMLPQYDPRMQFVNPFVTTMQHPFMQPFNVNPALYNLYRPITY